MNLIMPYVSNRDGRHHRSPQANQAALLLASLLALAPATYAAEAEAPEAPQGETQTQQSSGWIPGKKAFELTLREVHPLKSTGKVSLDDVNGRVEIKAWDREEVEIRAVKRAKSQERLDEVKVEIDAKPDRLVIHTKYPKEKKHWNGSQGSVDYVLTVPKTVRLEAITTVNGDVVVTGISGNITASTVNGSVRVKGSAGDLTLSSVNGAIDAAPASVTSDRSVALSTVNGGVTLTLPAQADAKVSANTVNGGVHSDHPQLTVKKGWPVGSSLNGTVGSGSAKVKASAVNGGVRIKQAGNS
jgi:DUF4097 and DUF4098 domain-containing protein YvlB